MSTAGNPNEETVPCANTGCHFWGRPSTGNFCSKCYKEQVKEENNDNTTVVQQESKRRSSKISVKSTTKKNENAELKVEEVSAKVEEDTKPIQKNRKRCWTCKKKVGYTGIECRCGFVFCGTHRYPDTHDCQFDFKKFDREQLAKRNNKIETAKLEDKL